MKGRERWHAGGRQIAREVDPVQMDEIDPCPAENHRDRVPTGGPGGFHFLLAQVQRRCRKFDQLAGDARSGAGDDDRPVPLGDESRVEKMQHLLGAAHGACRDRGQRKGDLKDGQHRATMDRHCAPSMPQSKRS